MTHAVFAGLLTLDVIQRVPRLPDVNEKIVASSLWVQAGGPAANASVACQMLNVGSTLVTLAGESAVGFVAKSDVAHMGVEIQDCAPAATEWAPPVSTVLVQERTGDRAVISTNSVAAPPAESLSALPADTGVLLVDGHHMDLGLESARLAKSRGILVLLDAGSWKPGFETLLPLCDAVLASDDFRIPGSPDVVAGLHEFDIKFVAVSRGSNPIGYSIRGGDNGEVPIE